MWATRTPRHATNVVLINPDPVRSHLVAVQAPGGATATLLRLTAPSLGARTGTALGGQQFSRTTDGSLPTPRTSRVSRAATGSFNVALAPGSAALLTLKRA